MKKSFSGTIIHPAFPAGEEPQCGKQYLCSVSFTYGPLPSDPEKTGWYGVAQPVTK